VGGVPEHSLTAWVLFNAMVLAFLALDLGVINRKAHEVTFREAVFWNVVWTVLGLLFGLVVARLYGRDSGVEYLTGYVIERALSIDNIFVFVIVFRYFSVPPQYQHRVLYWGILGALVMRAALIFAGAVIVGLFHWVLYLFGAFLVVTGFKMWIIGDHVPDIASNPLLKFLKRHMRVTEGLRGNAFWVRETDPATGALERFATPLLMALVLVEFVDLIFAVDSVPAIFAITREPLLVFTSNVCAILGLRTLYFLLAGAIERFHLLHYALAAILVFVGLKMVWLNEAFGGKFPIEWSLGAIAAILAAAVAASLLSPRRSIGPPPAASPP